MMKRMMARAASLRRISRPRVCNGWSLEAACGASYMGSACGAACDASDLSEVCCEPALLTLSMEIQGLKIHS